MIPCRDGSTRASIIGPVNCVQFRMRVTPEPTSFGSEGREREREEGGGREGGRRKEGRREGGKEGRKGGKEGGKRGRKAGRNKREEGYKKVFS